MAARRASSGSLLASRGPLREAGVAGKSPQSAPAVYKPANAQRPAGWFGRLRLQEILDCADGFGVGRIVRPTFAYLRNGVCNRSP